MSYFIVTVKSNTIFWRTPATLRFDYRIDDNRSRGNGLSNGFCLALNPDMRPAPIACNGDGEYAEQPALANGMMGHSAPALAAVFPALVSSSG